MTPWTRPTSISRDDVSACLPPRLPRCDASPASGAFGGLAKSGPTFGSASWDEVLLVARWGSLTRAAAAGCGYAESERLMPGAKDACACIRVCLCLCLCVSRDMRMRSCAVGSPGIESPPLLQLPRMCFRHRARGTCPLPHTVSLLCRRPGPRVRAVRCILYYVCETDSGEITIPGDKTRRG